MHAHQPMTHHNLRPRIEVVSEAFDMPQLGKQRRIYALLPHDYDYSGKNYPVLYLQDAQNLFNPYAPFGNWAIDQSLAEMTARGLGDVIVIAIEHGGSERINEFMPFSTQKHGTGYGKHYVRFLAESLKPYIDQRYRTMHTRQYTGIGGSSLGGLISIYAGLMYPETFGRLMVFSPSLWVTQRVNFNTIRFFNPITTRIYVYAGGHEGANMVGHVKRFREAIGKKGLDDTKVRFKLSVDPKGQHTEWRWGQEFPKALEWLFYTR